MTDVSKRLAEIRRHAEEVRGWTEMLDDASSVLVDARYARKPMVPSDVPLGSLMLGADVLWLLGAYDHLIAENAAMREIVQAVAMKAVTTYDSEGKSGSFMVASAELIDKARALLGTDKGE